MDIELFDRRYPSPAHAAAADLRDRYALTTISTKRRAFHQNNSGAITVVVALAVALLGVVVYVIKPNNDRPIKYSIYAGLPISIQNSTTRSLPIKSSLSKQDTVLHKTTVRHFSAYRVHQPRSKIAKSILSGRSSSKWIANPLSGDALAAALIVDKRQTVELNAEQLRLLAVTRKEQD